MTSLKTFLYRIICGFLLGISTFAPGFSGSILAITMGVYADLVRIMSNPLDELRKNSRLLLPILIGGLLSGILFVLTFQHLFERHQKATLLLFVGLIAGNLPVIQKEVGRHSFAKRYLVGGLISFAISLAMGLMAIDSVHSAGDGAVVSLLSIAVSGFAIGAVALVPGMSISAVLIMLGVYGELITMANAILRFNFGYLPHLIAVAACAVLGLVLTSRGIRRFFSVYPGLANTCVLGFMSGSMLGIFAQSLFVQQGSSYWMIGLCALVAGLVLSRLFILFGRSMGRLVEE